MTKSYDTQVEPERAILVGVATDNDLDELEALCETCNILTVGRITQNIKEPDVTYYIGSGKVEEVYELVKQHDATVVVFDVELSGSKVRNLENKLGVPVLDRSKIILDIFAARAQSAEGQLQVELAQLKYNLPRLIGSGGLLAKMKTAVGMRGPGEKKLELDRRKIRDEITALERKLEKLKSNRELSNKQADKSGKHRVCLVGYTNSGKSTLLNAIAKTSVLAEDKLFATLDPKTAKVFLERRRSVSAEHNPQGQSPEDVGDEILREPLQILLTDTVGFINRLPHEFIRAFESTLDSVRNANLLLHVVDYSNDNYATQIDVVKQVLEKIGASNIPTIMVYNKIDRVSPVTKSPIKKESNTEVEVSAKNNINIDLLKSQIVDILNAL